MLAGWLARADSVPTTLSVKSRLTEMPGLGRACLVVEHSIACLRYSVAAKSRPSRVGTTETHFSLALVAGELKWAD